MMKTGGVFWGGFLVVLGSLFLSKNFGIMGDSWEGIWKLWPLTLIALGVSNLLINEAISKVLAAVSGVLSGAIIWTLLQNPLHALKVIPITFNSSSPSSSKSSLIPQLLNATYTEKIKRAIFTIDAGVGEFSLSQSTSELIHLETKTSLGGYTLNTDFKDSVETLHIEMNDSELKLGEEDMRNETQIKLNINPIWDLNFNISAASLKFDLTAFKVEKLTLNSDMAAIKVRLGDKSEKILMTVEAGASSVRIELPKTMGAEVSGELELSDKVLEGFKAISPSVYRTVNFDSTSKKIYIQVDANLSSLIIKRY
jgi:hypothetical protein